MDRMAAPRLLDFDWSVRLALSSDKISTLRQGLLLLMITTVNSNGIKEETLLEFNDTELDSFLNLLNDAKKAAEAIQ